MPCRTSLCLLFAQSVRQIGNHVRGDSQRDDAIGQLFGVYLVDRICPRVMRVEIKPPVDLQSHTSGAQLFELANVSTGVALLHREWPRSVPATSESKSVAEVPLLLYPHPAYRSKDLVA